MAKRVRWTRHAKADRINILTYFIERNKSAEYSKKLNKLFIKEIKYISEYPNIGKPSNAVNIRVKVTGDYYIIYQIDSEEVVVLRIWDTRQDPIKLIKIHKPKG